MERRREKAIQCLPTTALLLCFLLCIFSVHPRIARASIKQQDSSFQEALRFAASKAFGVPSSSKMAFREEKRISGGVGPGSAPPRCRSKCGKCNPCRPVHAPVPPSEPVMDEYYPVAWRCKCGNRLFMPSGKEG